MPIVDIATSIPLYGEIAYSENVPHASVLAAYASISAEMALPAAVTISSSTWESDDGVRILDLGFAPLPTGNGQQIAIFGEGGVALRSSGYPSTPSALYVDTLEIPTADPIDRLYTTDPIPAIMFVVKSKFFDMKLWSAKWATSPAGALIYGSWARYSSASTAVVEALFQILSDNSVRIIASKATQEVGIFAILQFDESKTPATIYTNAIQPEPTFTLGDIGRLYEFTLPPATPPATLSGIVRDRLGTPASRAVRLYQRSTGALLASTTSDPDTGEYSFRTALPGEKQIIFVSDDVQEGLILNDLVHRVLP
jgi:hypothetical protein